MQRRIPIKMVTMEKYRENFNNGITKDKRIHQILLSNCHMFPSWIGIAIDDIHDNQKESLWIGVDV